VCHAQQAKQAAPICYHFGDDPEGKLGWANPNFDDSAWPVAKDGRWPMPPIDSDGFVWVRFHIPLRSGVSGPFAVRNTREIYSGVTVSLLVDEVYVGGALVGRQGSLPPNPMLSLHHQDAVFDIPAGQVTPGTTAVVAIRVWCPPRARLPVFMGDLRVSVDERRNLLLAYRADHATALISDGLNLALNGLVALFSVGLLFVWRKTGKRDLLMCGVMLISLALFSLLRGRVPIELSALSWRTYALIWVAFEFITMAATIEFVWTVNSLRAPVVKCLYYAFVILLDCADLVLFLAMTPSMFARWSILGFAPLFGGFCLVQGSVNLWVLLVRRQNTLPAVTMIALSASGMLEFFGVFAGGIKIGPFYMDYIGLAFLLCEIALLLLLGQRAMEAWRTRDELRVEFDAAREVQQQLVTPAVDLPGFKIASAYVPAKQVGGDFFRVLPEADDSALIVMGDVSGKGLKAAMTVSAIMGALPGCRSRKPSEVLAHLNEAVYGRIGGFVTCCVAHISPEGTMTIANAGNPAPYRNGSEMPVDPGLPLGLLADATYGETHYQLAPNDRLTFVSDGVLEATNPQGELYGFERTARLSTEPAEKVAQAAQAFGQEDDITVLTLALMPQQKEVAA
jgi:hypothetical protein